MQKFYYKEIKDLTALLQALTAVAEKYNNRDADVSASLLQWLATGIKFYKDGGKAEKESRLQLLKAEMVTALRNINPITFEKINLHRQELHATIAFKIVQAAEAQLRFEITALQENIQAASDLATQVIVAGLQAGIITDDLIKNAKKQTDLEALWALLSADGNIALWQKRILLTVSIYDVWILLDEVLSRLRN